MFRLYIIDLASRDIDPKQIQKATVWWEGPQFLSEHDSNWPEGIIPPVEVPEKRAYCHTVYLICWAIYFGYNLSLFHFIQFIS